MFSGIIEEMATIVAIEQEKDNIHFTLSCSFAQDLKIDQSVAHNGACLTVVRISGDTYTVTAMKETLIRSAPLHFSLGNKARLCLKKKKRKQKSCVYTML